MFSTCLFCHRSLDANEVIEHLPIGRRIAFDPARGRLWVVCRHCERWNLTPFDDRWEALEECEREFRGTRLRQSTDNVGLARVKEGLDLVRIGEPLRPEFAAWRYGDQFGRRRRRAILYTAGGVAAVGAVLGGAAMLGIGVGFYPQFAHAFLQSRTAVKVRDGGGRLLRVRYAHLQAARLIQGPVGTPWALELRHVKGRETFHGDEALRIAGLILPKVNRSGASASRVEAAVRDLERLGGPAAFLEAGPRGHVVPASVKRGGALHRLPVPTRLALEMALHEEEEHRALAGELRRLEAAWKEAEEIAAIADRLTVPDDALDALDRARFSRPNPLPPPGSRSSST